jgi:spore maturation protein SpmB
MAGLIAVSIYQRINLLQPIILAYLGSITIIIAGLIYYFLNLPQDQVGPISSFIGNFILFTIIIIFIWLGIRKNVNVFNEFIEGAKDGFGVAVKIIPYLIGLLVAIGVFRASGTLAIFESAIEWTFAAVGFNTDFVPALPTAFMKPLSGSGARGMMVETMTAYGADSFAGRLSSIFQGSTETTFYVIAVYFGSVGIRHTRYAVACGLIADFCGIVAAIFIAYMFFH